MTDFNRTNERGTVRRQRDNSLEFTYWNDFYGECSFSARVVRTPEGQTALDRASMEYSRANLKGGNFDGLLRSAETFFARELRRFSHPRELDSPCEKEGRTQAGWTLIQQALLRH